MLALDVDSDESVNDGVKELLDETGHLDVLVNNAGYVLSGGAEANAEGRTWEWTSSRAEAAVKGGDMFWTNYAYISDYHPFRRKGLRNREFGRRDRVLLDLKSDRDDAVCAAVTGFALALDELMIPGVAMLAAAPGHMAAATNRGGSMSRVLNMLSMIRRGRYLACPDALLRVKTVKKLAQGGAREVGVHLDSIKASEPSLVAGRIVVVLDDVATTGNTIRACRRLLLEAGATQVGALVWARRA